MAQNRYLLSSGEDDGQAAVKIGRLTSQFEDLEKIWTNCRRASPFTQWPSTNWPSIPTDVDGSLLCPAIRKSICKMGNAGRRNDETSGERQRRAIDQVSLGPGRLRSNQNDPRSLRPRRSRPQRRSLLQRHNRSRGIDAAGHQRVAGRVRLRACLGAAAVNENYDPTLDSGIGQLERLGWA